MAEDESAGIDRSRIKTYRDIAAETVAAVLAETGMSCRPSLLKALKKAYPFSDLKGWPYKVWLQEVKAKTGGFKPRKDKRQLDLFDGERVDGISG